MYAGAYSARFGWGLSARPSGFGRCAEWVGAPPGSVLSSISPGTACRPTQSLLPRGNFSTVAGRFIASSSTEQRPTSPTGRRTDRHSFPKRLRRLSASRNPSSLAPLIIAAASDAFARDIGSGQAYRIADGWSRTMLHDGDCQDCATLSPVGLSRVDTARGHASPPYRVSSRQNRPISVYTASRTLLLDHDAGLLHCPFRHAGGNPLSTVTVLRGRWSEDWGH